MHIVNAVLCERVYILMEVLAFRLSGLLNWFALQQTPEMKSTYYDLIGEFY